MMENITLGEIAKVLAFIVALIGSIAYLKNILTKTVSKALTPINKKIDDLEMSYIKTDLVNFMGQAEMEQVSKEQNLNAHELYDRYCKLGGNSYIHDKWEKLRKEGKI